MALLAVILAIASPSLARFFRGRKLDSEAQRFLALTRYAQSRAVSEGVPTVLWMDTTRGAYGLEAESSYVEQDARAVVYEVDESVELSLDQAAATTALPWEKTLLISGSRPMIRFTPDGFIGDDSPERILFTQNHENDDGSVQVGRSRNRLNYEIQTDIGRATPR